MKTLFICLANSKKLGDRCVAGIEVEKIDNTYQAIKKQGKPNWLRPISKSQHGEISKALVSKVSLMDIIEIDIEEKCPKGYQAENVTFKSDSIKKVGAINLSEENLELFIDKEQHYLFGNKGKAVHEDDINSLNHSLTLIKVTDFEVNRKGDDNQIRINFQFNKNRYDLNGGDVCTENLIAYCYF